MKDLFNYACAHELDFIVRARHDRIVNPNSSSDKKKFWQHLRSQEAKAEIQRQFLDRQGRAYMAKCSLFWKTIQPNGVEKPIQVL